MNGIIRVSRNKSRITGKQFSTNNPFAASFNCKPPDRCLGPIGGSDAGNHVTANQRSMRMKKRRHEFIIAPQEFSFVDINPHKGLFKKGDKLQLSSNLGDDSV